MHCKELGRQVSTAHNRWVLLSNQPATLVQWCHKEVDNGGRMWLSWTQWVLAPGLIVTLLLVNQGGSASYTVLRYLHRTCKMNLEVKMYYYNLHKLYILGTHIMRSCSCM